MRVIICGSRSCVDPAHLDRALEACGYDITEVVCGGAAGADALGEQWARHEGIAVTVINADWNRHGRAAGIMRNIKMARMADAVLALYDGSSPGTRHMINHAKEKGLDVYVHLYESEEHYRQQNTGNPWAC